MGLSHTSDIISLGSSCRSASHNTTESEVDINRRELHHGDARIPSLLVTSDALDPKRTIDRAFTKISSRRTSPNKLSNDDNGSGEERNIHQKRESILPGRSRSRMQTALTLDVGSCCERDYSPSSWGPERVLLSVRNLGRNTSNIIRRHSTGQRTRCNSHTRPPEEAQIAICISQTQKTYCALVRKQLKTKSCSPRPSAILGCPRTELTSLSAPSIEKPRASSASRTSPPETVRDWAEGQSDGAVASPCSMPRRRCTIDSVISRTDCVFYLQEFHGTTCDNYHLGDRKPFGGRGRGLVRSDSCPIEATDGSPGRERGRPRTSRRTASGTGSQAPHDFSNPWNNQNSNSKRPPHDGSPQGDPPAVPLDHYRRGRKRPERRFHCVFYHAPGEETDDCGTKKEYVSQLVRHHDRHNFYYCRICFEKFQTKDERDVHVGTKCVLKCVNKGCHNYRQEIVSSQEPCTHKKESRQRDQWRELFRMARPEDEDVPDPDEATATGESGPQQPLPEFDKLIPTNIPAIDIAQPYEQLNPAIARTSSKLLLLTRRLKKFATRFRGRGAGLDQSTIQNVELISEHMQLSLNQLDQTVPSVSTGAPKQQQLFTMHTSPPIQSTPQPPIPQPPIHGGLQPSQLGPQITSPYFGPNMFLPGDELTLSDNAQSGSNELTSLDPSDMSISPVGVPPPQFQRSVFDQPSAYNIYPPQPQQQQHQHHQLPLPNPNPQQHQHHQTIYQPYAPQAPYPPHPQNHYQHPSTSHPHYPNVSEEDAQIAMWPQTNPPGNNESHPGW